MSGPLEVTYSPSAVIARIQRPDTRNAINSTLMAALERLLGALEDDGDARTLVLRGSGGVFASGGDLREFGEMSGAQAGAMLDRMRGILQRIETLPGITVAAIEGAAVGGGAELSLAFDLRLATDTSYFRFPQVQLGIPTGWEGTRRLGEAVGYTHALEILLSGRRVCAAEAAALGLATASMPPERFEAELASLLAQISGSPAAAPAVKSILRQQDRRRAAVLERKMFETLWDTPRRREAMRRVLDRSERSGR